MTWSKKSSPKNDASQSKQSFFASIMKWFRKSTAVRENSPEPSPLQTEENVVPKTEFTASRQALNNINLALGAGESSGESSGALKIDNKSGCKNKYCCDVSEQAHQPDDKCDDESIKDNKNSKTTLIENLRAADNSARATDGSTNETERRPSNVKNSDFIIAPLDYLRLECPDYSFPSILDNSGLKNRRFYMQNCELFLSKDKSKSEDDEKTPLDFWLLSNLEKHLDETKFNLLRCKAYNKNWQRIKGISQSGFEDFRDDGRNVLMSDDTRAIKIFYNLTMESDILMHFQEITIDFGLTVETYSRGCLSFFKWLALKGKEIKESHKVKTSWIKAIFKFFSELSK